MSFQAGISYFTDRRITEAEAGSVRSWVQSGGGASPASYRHEGVLLAHSAPHFGRRAIEETQPFLGRTCAVTFDGRLDNRKDLLLRLRSVLNADTSDAALAAAAYESWGADGLAHLIGDWSLAIWDWIRKTILLASDFAGVRPLYYCVRSDFAFWSTRLLPLVHWARIDEIDDLYAAGFLAHGGCPNRTPYREVYSVPPGHCVQITKEGTRIRPFWRLPIADTIRYGRESEYEDHLRALFREAVGCRMPTDAACLCELSGGLDSSSVVSMAAEMQRVGEVNPDRLVTLSFEHENSLDKQFYTLVEQFCGLESVHVSTADHAFVTATDAGESVPMFWGPLLKHTATIARQLGATTYVTGQLGDAMMGNWGDDSEQVAGLLHTARFGAALKQAFEWSKVLRVPISWILGRALLSNLPLSLGAAKYSRLTGWPDSPQDTEDSIAPSFHKRAGLPDPRDMFSQGWVGARPERRKHFRALMRTLELRGLQAPEPLEHLSYVHPYAHRPLVTFLLSIPADIVCRPGEPRRLMRRAFGEFWPPQLRQRRSKDGFGAVFLDSLRPLARELLQGGQPLQVVKRGYVDRQSLERRLARLSSSLSCNESQLRHIILLELWLRNRERQPRSAPLLRAVSAIVKPAS